ncbi:AraC family transcriptional regulator [Mycolicibacterium mucogenicum]|uniref:AraC family transcriptional regulator n=1 Tax=Mycolicibacterium mucogenicum TaxID=56689 RepID=UPI002269E74C|nr:AraC family transcriptional regulator [Mycolicibacterium mucogenicum]MCX8561345.1 AraC family transcriptional regulator [Mycolicibacterium mucogenicum]
MDALAGLLEGPRARGAFLMRSLLDPPWSLRVQDQAPLTIVVVARGAAAVLPDNAAGRRLEAGDIAIFRGPDGYTVADDVATAPGVVVHPGQVTTTVDGEPLCEALSLGIRSWGTRPDAETLLITGAYEEVGAVCRRLLTALPPLVVVRRGEVNSMLIDLLLDEMSRDEPAQGAVLDRMLDLLTIAALRSWFSREEAPAWYRAYRDPQVGTALRLIENNPAHPWTVGSLAAEVGLSRAALARRFTQLVGEPPMALLTEIRLALAVDLLRGSDATIEAVAGRVGYGTAFALSTAIKRRYGMSPKAIRAASP